MSEGTWRWCAERLSASCSQCSPAPAATAACVLRGSACAAKLCEGSHWADEHARGGQQRTGPKLQPGAINSELLVRVPGALPLVVGLLDGATGGDFYVAYYTVQLLTALGAGNMPRLQEVRALLASLDMEDCTTAPLCSRAAPTVLKRAGSAGGPNGRRKADGPAGQRPRGAAQRGAAAAGRPDACVRRSAEDCGI